MRPLILILALATIGVSGCSYLKSAELTQDQRSRVYDATPRAAQEAVIAYFVSNEYTIEDSDYDSGVVRFDAKVKPAGVLSAASRETVSAFIRDMGSGNTRVMLNILKERQVDDEWVNNTDSRANVVQREYDTHLSGIAAEIR